ncbi:MAG: hypothetical protein HKL95_01105 [Phycisphaerae bacterium]|nr:hypothetical protein [Phycisphaerae bacterium]
MDLKPAFQEEFLLAMASLYRRVDVDIAGRQGVCIASGRCCRFEEYGHRLYVTQAELIYFYAVSLRPELDPAKNNSEAHTAVLPRTAGFPLPLYNGDGEFAPGCPWQVQGMCSARSGRPLGCRIYFCDSGSRGWQGPVYEYWHQQITDMHVEFDIGYSYLEWRNGLALLRRAEDQITDSAMVGGGPAAG